MTYTIRPYQPDSDDLSRMIGLIQEAWSPERRPDAYFHVGDLYWRLRQPSYEQNLWLWEQASNLVAFAEWLPDEAQLFFQMHPAQAGSHLAAAILEWAENEAPRPQVDDPSTLASLTTSASESDPALITLLTAKGYLRRDRYTNCHLYNYSEAGSQAIEAPLLSDGYVVRHLFDPKEIASRVKGHRDGWQSAKMTVDIYHRMMSLPGYRLDLDIVVVAPDGTIAATCNCWLDERSGAGLIEPVSTHADHRRRGLGRAVVCKGIRQLLGLGARTVWVSSVSHNPAATALYISCGMRVARREYDYQR